MVLYKRRERRGVGELGGERSLTKEGVGCSAVVFGRRWFLVGGLLVGFWWVYGEKNSFGRSFFFFFIFFYFGRAWWFLVFGRLELQPA